MVTGDRQNYSPVLAWWNMFPDYSTPLTLDSCCLTFPGIGRQCWRERCAEQWDLTHAGRDALLDLLDYRRSWISRGHWNVQFQSQGELSFSTKKIASVNVPVRSTLAIVPPLPPSSTAPVGPQARQMSDGIPTYQYSISVALYEPLMHGGLSSLLDIP